MHFFWLSSFKNWTSLETLCNIFWFWFRIPQSFSIGFDQGTEEVYCKKLKKTKKKLYEVPLLLQGMFLIVIVLKSLNRSSNLSTLCSILGLSIDLFTKCYQLFRSFKHCMQTCISVPLFSSDCATWIWEHVTFYFENNWYNQCEFYFVQIEKMVPILMSFGISKMVTKLVTSLLGPIVLQCEMEGSLSHLILGLGKQSYTEII